MKSEWTLSDPCSLILTLQLYPYLPGLDWDLFREELAITELDGLLAPCPRSRERFARQHPFGPPAGFRPPSSCPGHDRSVSSLTATTKGPFRPSPSGTIKFHAEIRFPFAFGLLTLKLAVTVNSPARVSRRSVRPWNA